MDARTDTPEPKPARWRNPYRRLPAVRWGVQLLYAVFLLAVGYEFLLFYGQAIGDETLTHSRPPAVEAFLPISALVGLKRFLATGRWDEVHPAGLTILVGALAGSLLARKSFCSWICPVGTFSRALEVAGQKLLWRRRRDPLVPVWLDRALTALKYPVLGFFAWAVFFGMDGDSAEAFVFSTYNVAADAKMLLFFVQLSVTGAVVLGVLTLLSLVIKNFWCRYLCPYGALLGVFSAISPQRVVRDPKTCTDCKACTRACPVEIRVHAKATVLSPECTGCMNCVAACPIKDCLTVGRRAEKGWPVWLVPAAGVGALLVAWGVARATGHWTSELPIEMFRMAYRMAAYGGLGHP